MTYIDKEQPNIEKICPTAEEIYNMFDESNISEEFKILILNRFNALCQAMYNCLHNPEKTMKMQDSHADMWVEEHNRFVTEYQRYIS